jgi:uncharacterized delta-60 repeat protein
MNRIAIHSITTAVLLACTGTLRGQNSFVDPTFNPGSGANDLVESVLAQPDGRILVCGIFTQFNGTPRNYIARLNSNGAVDTSFSAGPSYWVRCMALQPDGKIVIGGFFTSVGGVARNRIARLNADGTLDPTFNPGAGCQGKIVQGDDKDPFVFWLLVQGDGKIVVAGNFATFNNQPSSGLVRLNPDGSADTGFAVGAGFNSWGRFLLPLPNDQVLATGWFTTYNNQPFNRMVRLNSDGSPDHGFNPFFGDETAIYAAVWLPDGKLIAAGHSINPQGLFHQEIERLNPDGAVDTSYHASASDKVESIYLQPNGKIVIGGYFSQVDGVTRKGLARLNEDGSLDEGFRADTDNFVWTVRPQPDGNILICGGFTSVDGAIRRGVARLFGSDDGVVLPRLTSPQWDHGRFRVSIQTTNGHEYILQYRQLNSSRWRDLPAVAGDGTVHQFVDPDAGSSPNRVYRAYSN